MILSITTTHANSVIGTVFTPGEYTTTNLENCSDGELVINTKNSSLLLGQSISFFNINHPITSMKSPVGYPACITKTHTTLNLQEKLLIEKREMICKDHQHDMVSISSLQKINGKLIFKAVEHTATKKEKVLRKVQCEFTKK